MQVLERFFEAMRSHDWETLGACVAADVHRTGPFLDVVEGRAAYVAFLAKTVPALQNYSLVVSRTRRLEDGAVLVELSEILDMNGVSTEIPEALLFDFDAAGLIRRVDIFIKQPPAPRPE